MRVRGKLRGILFANYFSAISHACARPRTQRRRDSWLAMRRVRRDDFIGREDTMLSQFARRKLTDSYSKTLFKDKYGSNGTIIWNKTERAGTMHF